MVSIRRVSKGDEQSLAYIQTESWKAAFSEILDAENLARCTQPDKATAMYEKLIEDGVGNGYLLEVDGAPHCIAWWDKTREENMSGYAELICIHSLQDRWYQGYGSLMMERVLADVRKAGYEKIMLWVFEENARAISFYKKYGFEPSGVKQPALGAVEVMYEKSLI